MTYRYEDASLRVKALSTEGALTFTEPSGSTTDTTVTFMKRPNTNILDIVGDVVVSGATVTFPVVTKVVKQTTDPTTENGNIFTGANKAFSLPYREFNQYLGTVSPWSSITDWYNAPTRGFYSVTIVVRGNDATGINEGFIPIVLHNAIETYCIETGSVGTNNDHTFWLPTDGNATTGRRMATWSSIIYMDVGDVFLVRSKATTVYWYAALTMHFLGIVLV